MNMYDHFQKNPYSDRNENSMTTTTVNFKNKYLISEEKRHSQSESNGGHMSVNVSRKKTLTTRKNQDDLQKEAL